MGSYRRNIVFDPETDELLKDQPNMSEAVRYAVKQTFKRNEDDKVVAVSKARNVKVIA